MLGPRDVASAWIRTLACLACADHGTPRTGTPEPARAPRRSNMTLTSSRRFSRLTIGPELDLGAGAADLDDDGRGSHGDDPGLEPDPVVGPHSADVALSGDQDACVVDDRCHAVRRPAVRPARRRAVSSSLVVRGPLSASHSATAAGPDRTSSARRAAAVIHAEKLTPSAAAALTTWAWTSGSTVKASFGDGLPRGIRRFDVTAGHAT